MRHRCHFYEARSDKRRGACLTSSATLPVHASAGPGEQSCEWMIKAKAGMSRMSAAPQLRPIHGISLGGIALALIGGWIFHVNPLVILGLMSGDGASSSSVQNAADQPARRPPADDPQAQFVSQVLRSTETVWTTLFRERGLTYQDPKLRLFRDSYPTACGQGEAAAGPFYCFQDRVVYLDLGFFDVMTGQLGASGNLPTPM